MCWDFSLQLHSIKPLIGYPIELFCTSVVCIRCLDFFYQKLGISLWKLTKNGIKTPTTSQLGENGSKS